MLVSPCLLFDHHNCSVQQKNRMKVVKLINLPTEPFPRTLVLLEEVMRETRQNKRLNQERNVARQLMIMVFFIHSRTFMEVDIFMCFSSIIRPVCHHDLQIFGCMSPNGCKHEYICNGNICRSHYELLHTGTEWLESPCCQQALTWRGGITGCPWTVYCSGPRLKEWMHRGIMWFLFISHCCWGKNLTQTKTGPGWTDVLKF